MTDVVIELRKDVFYGDERMHRMAEHNPLHLRAADEITALRARLEAVTQERDDACEELMAAQGQIADALAAKLAEVEAERDAWQRNSRETFDAMVSMRNSINEHIPMPSLESDLLHGPENSVFCATVAQAVIEFATEGNQTCLSTQEPATGAATTGLHGSDAAAQDAEDSALPTLTATELMARIQTGEKE